MSHKQFMKNNFALITEFSSVDVSVTEDKTNFQDLYSPCGSLNYHIHYNLFKLLESSLLCVCSRLR